MRANTNKPKLTKAAKDLVDSFSEQAKSWGWQEDRGVYNVDQSEKSFLEAKADLEAYILKLQIKIKKLQSK